MPTGEVRLTTDAAGEATFRGYLGAYRLTGPKGSAEFGLDKAGAHRVSVRTGAKN